MSLPVLYGTAGSRAFRSIWAAEEINLAYEHVPTSFRGDNQAEVYLRINPNGRIPALVDGDLTLFESMAINLYLETLWPTPDSRCRWGGSANPAMVNLGD